MGANWEVINLFCSLVAQDVIPVTLLMATPKRSPYRYLAIPFMIWNLYRFLYPIDLTIYARTTVVGNLLIGVITATNVLLINPLDERDLAREMPTTFFRSGHLYYTFEIITMSRGIKTPREAKNIPSHPAYYARYGVKPPVGRFLLRQFVIMAWQVLVIDIVQIAASLDERDRVFQDIPYDVPVQKWIERVIQNIIGWFVVSRVLIDFAFRASSIFFVGLGLDDPVNWRPAFGRMKDAYTLRNFWGKFWHQFLRNNFTSISNFVARDVLHLPRPSILERYTNIFIVFFLSAILHLVLDFTADIPWKLSGSMHFFLSFVLGIMIEDGVQAMWNRISPPEKSEDGEVKVPLWKKVVGMIWVAAWIGVFSTPYVERQMQLPPTDLMPFSLVRKFQVGIEPAGGLALVGAVFLWFTMAPEL